MNGICGLDVPVQRNLSVNEFTDEWMPHRQIGLYAPP